ncbi:MAG: PhnD/SsuA/transferrin family substrate-binding protein [Rhodospirillales bacterium]
MVGRASTLLILLVLAQAVAGFAPAQQASRVVFGVLAFDGEQGAHRQWDQTIAALSAAMPDHKFVLVPLKLDGANAALEANGLHFLLTNPGHFQNLMLRHHLAPLVSLRTDGPGQAKTDNRYGAVIFARNQESAPRRIADLKGLRFGAVAPNAFGGWQLALHTLRKNGLEPERDFNELRFFGFPQRSIVQAVLNGEIDAGTVRTGVLESMVARGEIPEGSYRVLNHLKVPDFDLALSTALVPEWLVAATRMADADLRREVARALLDLDPDHHANATTWQPPQSLAPVMEIKSALAEGDSDAASAGLPQLLLYGVVAIALSALVSLTAVHWFRPATGVSPATSPGKAPDSRELSDWMPESPLTSRENQILELVENGQTTKEIARLLSISPKTVEYHRHNLMQKFDASNMADLVHRSSLWRQPGTPKTDVT